MSSNTRLLLNDTRCVSFFFRRFGGAFSVAGGAGGAGSGSVSGSVSGSGSGSGSCSLLLEVDGLGSCWSCWIGLAFDLTFFAFACA